MRRRDRGDERGGEGIFRNRLLRRLRSNLCSPFTKSARSCSIPMSCSHRHVDWRGISDTIERDRTCKPETGQQQAVRRIAMGRRERPSRQDRVRFGLCVVACVVACVCMVGGWVGGWGARLTTGNKRLGGGACWACSHVHTTSFETMGVGGTGLVY